ncbi:MAG TPA: hypothetical protein VED45_10890 [Steroidobacteraceae bacterium]|nr:hypothetical protein [Steroidobacteraceae bacterium]
MNVTANEAQVHAARARRSALAGSLLLLAQLTLPAYAGPNEQAKRMYERLAGEPPPAAVLAQMEIALCGAAPCPAGTASLSPGDPRLITAAAIATDPVKYPNYYAHDFYNVTLKNWVIPWTNRDQTVFAPFNDYAATVIGMVRDDVPFNTALSADLLYTVNASGLPAPSNASNAHYATAEANGVDLSTALKQTTQSGTYGTPTAATAGLITTYAAEAAFFIKGTNRAMFRFTMINHFCNDMQLLMDTTRPTDRVRQDVARSPGGDSRVYLQTCVGCHSGMDPMAQAFAYYNFNGTVGPGVMNTGTMQYTQGQVQPKYLINSTNFVYGFVTPDDSWSNRWRYGINAAFGWSPSLPGSGSGAKSLGQEIESAQQFATCQVTKVFQAVCFRAPVSSADMSTVATITSSFESGGYKLKQVFQQVAAACPGQ